ncbi:MAG: hypothetical protein WEB07_03665, partial [Natronospirillum sp.]
MTESFTQRFVGGERVEPGVITRAELLGQGFFETLRWNGQRFPLLPWHEERLRVGAAWLGYDPEQLLTSFNEQLQTQVEPLLSSSSHAVVRFQWSHTQAARGYASAPTLTPVTLWQWRPLDQPLIT